MGPVQEDWIKETVGAASGRHNTRRKPERRQGSRGGCEPRSRTEQGWDDGGSLRHSHRSRHTQAHTPSYRRCSAAPDYSKCVFSWQHSFPLPRPLTGGSPAGEGRHPQQLVSLFTTFLQCFLLRKKCACYAVLYNAIFLCLCLIFVFCLPKFKKHGVF